MSADDNIEIEFPSLKQTAPDPVERVPVGRDPGPIEAQLSKPFESDDLSWLTAIFADEDPDTDADEVTDHGTDTVADEVEDPDPGEGTEAATELDAPTIRLPGDPPVPPSPFIQPDDGHVEPASPPAEMPANSKADDPDTDRPGSGNDEGGEESLDHEPTKKASGFREEIMSTFSQMYN